MELSQGLFAIKLHELDQAYAQMQSRLQICQNKEHSKIPSEIERMEDESRQAELALQRMVEHGRSPIAVSLAKAQQDYKKKVESSLEKLMSARMNGAERADAMTLYAEYAIDFAVLSMKHALLAALSAIDLQMDADEKTVSEENPK